MSQMISLIVVLTAACGTTTDKPAVQADDKIPVSPGVPSPAPGVPSPAPGVPAPGTASPRISCEADIAMECPDGYENGCGGGRTTSLVCVRKGALAVATCDSEITLRCPTGEINSCDAKPPYGTKHICVRTGP